MKLLASTLLLLLSANIWAVNTQYSGLYQLTCDQLNLRFSVGLGSATVTQTENAILLDADGASYGLTIPMDCTDPQTPQVDEAALKADLIQSCIDFENNEDDQWVAENLPCDAFASAGVWVWSNIANGLQPKVFTSLDMNVRRANSWIWRALGFDAVDYTAITAQGDVIEGGNMLINGQGAWGVLSTSGVPIPASGSYDDVTLTGCALTQTQTANGVVSVGEAGNTTTARTVVDQDVTCTASYGEETLGVNLSISVTANSTGSTN